MDSSPKKGLSAAAPAVPRPAAAKGRGDELVEAVRNNDEASVSALLELGVSPNCQTEFGTPLIVACERGLTGLVQTLLARGADPNLLAKDGSYALRAAVFCGDGEVINVLLGHAATNMNLVSARGTPLVVASGKLGLLQPPDDPACACTCRHGLQLKSHVAVLLGPASTAQRP